MIETQRAPRKRPQERREEIVRAALELLAEGGAPAVSTPALARRVGVTPSAVFKHFADKEAVWRAVMTDIAEVMGARLGAAVVLEGTCTERLFALLEAYLQAVADIPAIPALLFSGEVQAGGSASYLRDEIARRFGWLHEALRTQLLAGQATGEFRRDLDIEAAAVMAAGIAQSTILRWRVHGGAVDMLAESSRMFPLFLRVVTPAEPCPSQE